LERFPRRLDGRRSLEAMAWGVYGASARGSIVIVKELAPNEVGLWRVCVDLPTTSG
jgi:hypothetical protein